MYININHANFEKHKKEGTATMQEYGGENKPMDACFDKHLDVNLETWEFIDGIFNFAFHVKFKGDPLLYVSHDFPVDLDMAADVVTYFAKKLGKLKTVLEATKA